MLLLPVVVTIEFGLGSPHSTTHIKKLLKVNLKDHLKVLKAWHTAAPRPPAICRLKSAKAGVKSGPRDITLGSRGLIGNLFWFICKSSVYGIRSHAQCQVTYCMTIHCSNIVTVCNVTQIDFIFSACIFTFETATTLGLLTHTVLCVQTDIKL